MHCGGLHNGEHRSASDCYLPQGHHSTQTQSNAEVFKCLNAGIVPNYSVMLCQYGIGVLFGVSIPVMASSKRETTC